MALLSGKDAFFDQATTFYWINNHSLLISQFKIDYFDQNEMFKLLIQTMAHQPMHINDWIEIDKDYEWYLEEKKRVIREQGLFLEILLQ